MKEWSVGEKAVIFRQIIFSGCPIDFYKTNGIA